MVRGRERWKGWGRELGVGGRKTRREREGERERCGEREGERESWGERESLEERERAGGWRERES